MEACTIKKSRTGKSAKRWDKLNLEPALLTEVQDYRIFVATWNVGGKSPSSNLNLDDWLHASPPINIYVLGFQEIVLRTEANVAARKWASLIWMILNSLPGASFVGSYHTPSPVSEQNDDFEWGFVRQSSSSSFHLRSFELLSCSSRFDGDVMTMKPWLDRRFSECDRSRPSNFNTNFVWGGSYDDENVGMDSPSHIFFTPMTYDNGAPSTMEDRDR